MKVRFNKKKKEKEEDMGNSDKLKPFSPIATSTKWACSEKTRLKYKADSQRGVAALPLIATWLIYLPNVPISSGHPLWY